MKWAFWNPWQILWLVLGYGECYGDECPSVFIFSVPPLLSYTCLNYLIFTPNIDFEFRVLFLPRHPLMWGAAFYHFIQQFVLRINYLFIRSECSCFAGKYLPLDCWSKTSGLLNTEAIVFNSTKLTRSWIKSVDLHFPVQQEQTFLRSNFAPWSFQRNRLISDVGSNSNTPTTNLYSADS